MTAIPLVANQSEESAFLPARIYKYADQTLIPLFFQTTASQVKIGNSSVELALAETAASLAKVANVASYAKADAAKAGEDAASALDAANTANATAGNALEVANATSTELQAVNGRFAEYLPLADLPLSVDLGGSGRTDGAAQDVIFDDGAGHKNSAAAYGHFGVARVLGDVDFNTVITPGIYSVQANTGGAKNQPIKDGISALLKVFSSGGLLWQEYTSRTYKAFRRGNNVLGTGWDGWHFLSGGFGPSLTVYISKAGSDLNTGLESEYPVGSVARAFEVADSLCSGRSNLRVYFNFGEGDWGDVYINNKPYTFYIMPYDGQWPTAYSTSLPVFNKLDIRQCYTIIGGLVIDLLYVSFSHVAIYQRYKRIASINIDINSIVYMSSDSADTNIWEIPQRTATTNYNILTLSHNSYFFSNAIKVKLVENITANYFLVVDPCSQAYMQGANFTLLSSAYAFTGRKCYLNRGCRLFTGEQGPYVGGSSYPANINKYPGTSPAIECGAILDGWPYGAAAAASTASLQADDIAIANEPTVLDDAIEIVESPEPNPHGRLDIVVFANGGSEIIARISTEPLVRDEILLPLVAEFKANLEPAETPRKFSMTYTRISDSEVDCQWQDWLGEIEHPDQEPANFDMMPNGATF